MSYEFDPALELCWKSGIALLHGSWKILYNELYMLN